MPWMARAGNLTSPAPGDSAPRIAKAGSVAGNGHAPAPAERDFLLQLQLDSLRYFLDNQMSSGLVLDRQRNHGARRAHGLCSTATTGMGLIALALAAAPPYRLLPRGDAVRRARVAIEAALERLPDHRGVMPHFVHSATGDAHRAAPF